MKYFALLTVFLVTFGATAAVAGNGPKGPKDCDGVATGNIFGGPTGKSGDNFGNLISQLAKLGYENAEEDGEKYFPNENASARAAWAHRAKDVEKNAGDEVAQCTPEIPD